jgi:inner membrane protein
MLFKTHISFAFFISLFIYPHFTIYPILSIIIICLASTFPDLDHQNSKISKQNPLRLITRSILKHRGILHSLFAPLFLYLSLLLINPELASLAFIGYTSHLFIDSLTKRGIKPFHPLFNFKIKGNTKTGSFIEKSLFLLIIILILLKLFLPHWTYAREIFK